MTQVNKGKVKIRKAMFGGPYQYDVSVSHDERNSWVVLHKATAADAMTIALAYASIGYEASFAEE